MNGVHTILRQENSIEAVVEHILASGRITHADMKFFRKATLSDMALSPEEFRLITRILDRLQMGLLKVEG